MGLLDSVLGAIGGGNAGPGGGQGGGGQAALIGLVVSMLANRAGGQGGGLAGALGGLGAAGGLGGLGDLIGRFQQGGLGDIVNSWIGTGQNHPVSPDQVSSVLGSDMVAQIAQHLGVSHGDAAGQLSQVLPEVVDKMTPHGELPAEGSGLEGIGDILARFGSR